MDVFHFKIMYKEFKEPCAIRYIDSTRARTNERTQSKNLSIFEKSVMII